MHLRAYSMYMDNFKRKYANYAILLLFLNGIFLLLLFSFSSGPFMIQKSSSNTVSSKYNASFHESKYPVLYKP